MKTKTIVTSLGHEDLVELFSTSLYGSNSFAATYPKDIYSKYADSKDCFEDKLAKCLEHGAKITVYDCRADDKDDIQSKLDIPHTWSDDAGAYGGMGYAIGLEDIKAGLAKAVDASWDKSDFVGDTSDMEQRLRQHYINYICYEDGEFDNDDADALMQVIVFGTWVY